MGVYERTLPQGPAAGRAGGVDRRREAVTPAPNLPATVSSGAFPSLGPSPQPTPLPLDISTRDGC